MKALIVNGIVTNAANGMLSIHDRGLHYGDGLFETMRLHDGRIQLLAEHLSRLRLGCERLHIVMPEAIERDIAQLIAGQGEGIVKLIVTRGAGGRGYRSTNDVAPTRVAALYPPVTNLKSLDAITIRWCETRLGRNSLLAGIKHLNRLEQVLAQQEWQDSTIAEGLMLDSEGELISGTATNVFLVSDGVICTPDLRFSGIRGIMRGQVLKAAEALNVTVKECALWPQDLIDANEVFLTNAVRGIRPVTVLENCRWPIGDVTRRIAMALKLT